MIYYIKIYFRKGLTKDKNKVDVLMNSHEVDNFDRDELTSFDN